MTTPSIVAKLRFPWLLQRAPIATQLHVVLTATQLERVAHDDTFWFVQYAFRPETES